MGRLHHTQGQDCHDQQAASKLKGISRFATAFRRLVVPLLSSAVLMLVAFCTSTEPLTEDLGIHQVCVSDVFAPDSISAADTLVAILSGTTEVGNCLGLSHVDVDRDSAHVQICMWAHARNWLGPGPPPPCGTVGYRYEGLPPFAPGWFLVVVNQPDSSVRVDSIRVIP